MLNDLLAPGLKIVFCGTAAAQVFLGKRYVKFGIQTAQRGATRLFVLPSTSGAANGYWNVDFWYELTNYREE